MNVEERVKVTAPASGARACFACGKKTERYAVAKSGEGFCVGCFFRVYFSLMARGVPFDFDSYGFDPGSREFWILAGECWDGEEVIV